MKRFIDLDPGDPLYVIWISTRFEGIGFDVRKTDILCSEIISESELRLSFLSVTKPDYSVNIHCNPDETCFGTEGCWLFSDYDEFLRNIRSLEKSTMNVWYLRHEQGDESYATVKIILTMEQQLNAIYEKVQGFKEG